MRTPSFSCYAFSTYISASTEYHLHICPKLFPKQYIWGLALKSAIFKRAVTLTWEAPTKIQLYTVKSEHFHGCAQSAGPSVQFTTFLLHIQLIQTR